MATETTKLTYVEGAAAATPAAGRVVTYAKADGKMYSKDDAGVETPAGGSDDLDAIITASSGQDIADALSGAAAPDSGNVFATMADVGGGGGLAHSFVGYNTVGGSWETLTGTRHYYKQITLATAGTLASIDMYLRPSTDNTEGINVMVAADNSTAPGVLLAASGLAQGNIYLSNSSSMPGAARWLSIPVGAYLAAGTYWIGFMTALGRLDVAYDGSGSDQYFTATLFTATGAYPGSWAITTSSNKYSIRGNFLS